MKRALILLAAVTAVFAGTPSSAEARDYCSGDRRIVSYRYGRPVYAVYQIVGRDRYGRPIGRWVTIGSYDHDYHHSHGYYPSYGHSYGGYSHYSPYRRSSVGLSFSFGR